MKRKYGHKSEEMSRGRRNLGKMPHDVYSSTYIKRKIGVVAYSLHGWG
jgi:hypothetical protein